MPAALGMGTAVTYLRDTGKKTCWRGIAALLEGRFFAPEKENSNGQGAASRLQGES